MKDKRHLLLCIAALLPLAFLSAQPSGLRERLAKAFLQRLEAPASQPLSSFGQPVKAKDVQRYQSLVWEAWRDANAQYKEEKLIPMQEFGPKHWGAFHLPDSLEPNATMYYCFGKKLQSLAAVMALKERDSLAVPVVQDTLARLPFYLYIHGSGLKNDEWVASMQWALYFDDAPAAYMVPQIPNEGEYYRWWQKAKQYAWEKVFRQLFLNDSIDANRLYIFGISEGGYGSQRLASFYADYLAAAGPMAGGDKLDDAPVENCANIAFSLRTGADDVFFCRNILTRYAKEAFDSLEAKHPGMFRHWIELIPGYGHAIDYRPTTPWLSKQVRNPYPKTVLWEDFPTDHIHRKGFYNLQVLERPAERTYYEMNINGNRVDITASEVTYTVSETDTTWHMPIMNTRTYTPAKRGRLRIYLNDKLVDLSKPVTVSVNGKEAFRGKLKPDVRDMAESCALYFDPCRVYPASVEVGLE